MKLWREPLVHFVLLAGLLFALDQIATLLSKERIVVDRQAVAYLLQQRGDLVLRPLSAEERAEVLAAHVEDEILYREAYRRGLDRGDSRMRRNMILKMRGLLVGDVDPPNGEQLRDYFEADPERYARPATLSLEQVYFRDKHRIPEGLLAQLQAGLAPTSTGEDSFRFGRRLRHKSQRQLIATLGANAARAVLAITDEGWHGPFESIHGSHFVRILGREPASAVTFDQVRPHLESEWTLAQSHQAIARELDRLRDDYTIIIEAVEDMPR